MITDLDGGDPSPGRDGTVRAISIALAVAALIGYAALTRAAPGAPMIANGPPPTAATARPPAMPLFGAPDETRIAGSLWAGCAGEVRLGRPITVFLASHPLEGNPTVVFGPAGDRVVITGFPVSGWVVQLPGSGQSAEPSGCGATPPSALGPFFP